MSINKFEEFLMERHATEYIGTKDTMVDDFSDWLSKLGIDEFLNYGEWFANECIAKELKKRVKELEDKYLKLQMGDVTYECKPNENP